MVDCAIRVHVLKENMVERRYCCGSMVRESKRDLAFWTRGTLLDGGIFSWLGWQASCLHTGGSTDPYHGTFLPLLRGK
jgi:hypothetical protein